MAEFEAKHAIDVIAHRTLAAAWAAAGLVDWWGWDEFPDIGELDWRAVEDRMSALRAALNPSDDQVQAAYEFLSRRAGEA